MAGVDIRRWVCVIFSSYLERQCQAGAGDDVTTREVRQVEAVKTVRCAGADQWKGFRSLISGVLRVLGPI